jgi:hypothetical protein
MSSVVPSRPIADGFDHAAHHLTGGTTMSSIESTRAFDYLSVGRAQMRIRQAPQAARFSQRRDRDHRHVRFSSNHNAFRVSTQ